MTQRECHVPCLAKIQTLLERSQLQFTRGTALTKCAGNPSSRMLKKTASGEVSYQKPSIRTACRSPAVAAGATGDIRTLATQLRGRWRRGCRRTHGGSQPLLGLLTTAHCWGSGSCKPARTRKEAAFLLHWDWAQHPPH